VFTALLEIRVNQNLTKKIFLRAIIESQKLVFRRDYFSGKLFDWSVITFKIFCDDFLLLPYLTMKFFNCWKGRLRGASTFPITVLWNPVCLVYNTPISND